MSQPFGSNPYAPPGPATYSEKVLPATGPWQMDYFGGFAMIHRNPDWLLTALLLSLCALSGIFIPVIGTIVLNGYVYEAVESLHRTNGNYYPKFDFNRFVEYLVRGVGPFLIGLVLAMIIGLVVLFGYFAIVASAIAAGATADKGNEAAVGMSVLGALAVVGVLVFIVSTVIAFLSMPLSLRGGVSSDIGQSFNFGWAMDFIKKTWLEMLLVFLFQFGVVIVMQIVVLATCGIGALVAIGYASLISVWLQYQLYRVYLSRGGEPIPFKPAPLPMPIA
jgi:hypothetical protein